MNVKRLILFTLLGIVLAGAVSLVVIERTARLPEAAPARAVKGSPEAPQKEAVHLYFADSENAFLSAETRVLPHPPETTAFARAIVEALIEGPRTELTRTVPVQTTVRALYITSDGTLYLDLNEAVAETHPGGAQMELLTIYSLVNTLVLNLTDVDKVRLLIGGRDSVTLAGHIDLRSPFTADMLLIR